MKKTGLISICVLIVLFFLFILLNNHISFLFNRLEDHLFLFKHIKYINLIGMSVFMILTAIWGYNIAKKKKKNIVFWTLICFLFNFWGIIALKWDRGRARNNASSGII